MRLGLRACDREIDRRRRCGPVAVLAAVLALAVLVLYAPVLTHDFVDYDDDIMVTENPRVMSGLTLRGVGWALTTLEGANWQPVTWWSHMLDVSLFGRDARGHHGVSAALHALNASLLFLLLHAMTGSIWAPLAAAALFALHPLRVESVAWVAERKDVLSTAFWLLSTLAYVRWCRRPSVARYATSAAFFTLGLMAKPMLVTLPCTLLLLDFWPLGRFRISGGWSRGRLVLEKIPLFALAGAVSVVTFIAQRSAGAVAPLASLPAFKRLGNAVSAAGWYLAKTAWPSGLAVPVEMPHGGGAHAAQTLLATLLLAGGTAVAVALMRRRPYVVVGWFWFLGTLVPVSGLFQVGLQRVADRFTYVPLIGVALVVGYAAQETARVFGGRPRIVLLALTAAFALGAATREQLRHWKDTDSLFSRTLSLYPLNSAAHNNLGMRLGAAGRWEEAAEHFRLALLAYPDFGHIHFNLANALENLGRREEAVREYELSVSSLKEPERRALAHLRLARLLDDLGRPEEVTAHLERAAALTPRDNATAFDLGTVYLLQGRNEEAAGMLSRVVSSFPENVDARANLGYALMRLGRVSEAVRQFEAAMRLRPADATIRHEYGQALRRAGREEEALAEFREALRLQPAYRPALEALSGR